MNEGQATLMWIGIGVVALAVIGREVLCWFWKINEIVELLRSIDRKLVAPAEGDPAVVD